MLVGIDTLVRRGGALVARAVRGGDARFVACLAYPGGRRIVGIPRTFAEGTGPAWIAVRRTEVHDVEIGIARLSDAGGDRARRTQVRAAARVAVEIVVARVDAGDARIARRSHQPGVGRRQRRADSLPGREAGETKEAEVAQSARADRAAIGRTAAARRDDGQTFVDASEARARAARRLVARGRRGRRATVARRDDRDRGHQHDCFRAAPHASRPPLHRTARWPPYALPDRVVNVLAPDVESQQD